jgi:ketosteroid isomerase-like protein
MADPQAVDLVRRYQAWLAEERWDEWASLWSDDAVAEYPFAAPEGTRRVEGRDAIVEHMRSARASIAIDGLTDFRPHPCANRDDAVVELSITGRALSTGRPYDQSYVIIARSHAGRLTHWREYWNPLVSQAAFAD